MRRFAASVFAPRRDKPPSSGSDTSLRSADDPLPSKKSWKSWFKTPHHKLTLVVESSPSETDSDDVHPPPADLARLVVNSLHRPLTQSSSPFAHPSNAPFIFPRSCNPPHSSPPPPTLRTITLKRRLHHRLLVDPRRLLPQSPPLISPEPPMDDLIDAVPASTAVISLVSPGLTRWISRPCFEDRYTVYLPGPDGSIFHCQVSAASFAVADLEYSEALEAMVERDHLFHPSPILITTPPTPTPTSSSSPSPQSHIYIKPPQLAPASQLSSPPPVVSLPEPAPITASDSSHKRGVHFAEDDEKDDVIPLGYVLRQKQRRQEKAQFLRSEAERRALDEQMLKQQAEKHRQEAEREKERRVRESEQKLAEDMKKRMYAEQVAAARNRIESARAGGIPSLKSSYNNEPGGLVPTSAPSQTSERNKPPPTRRYSRQHEPIPPLVPPRREASEPNLPTVARTYPTFPPPPPSSHHDSSNSPGSSRPTSLSTPPTPNSLITPSTPVPSSDDVRSAVASMSRKKRTSYAAQSNSSGSLFGDRSASYPMWTTGDRSLNNVMLSPVPMMSMPAMMPVGYVMMDMPLLPPAPPFMMQQYSRQSSSQGSGSGSSRGYLSRESSQERASGGQRGSQSSHDHGHPRSASFPDELNSRRSSSSHVPPQHSIESRRASIPMSPQQHEKPRQSTSQQRSQHAQHTSLRSRPPLQQQSPWTGLPTQSGRLPNGMAQSRSPPSHSTVRSSSTRKHLVS